MTNDTIELKRRYNTLLGREQKAEKYLNNANEKQFKKWLPEYNNIIRSLSGLMYQIPEITHDEILNGFKHIE